MTKWLVNIALYGNNMTGNQSGNIVVCNCTTVNLLHGVGRRDLWYKTGRVTHTNQLHGQIMQNNMQIFYLDMTRVTII